jgi:hypothetical protein
MDRWQSRVDCVGKDRPVDEEAIAVRPGRGRTGQIVTDTHEHVWRTRSRHPTSDGVLAAGLAALGAVVAATTIRAAPTTPLP